jgi:uncharacterized iron-regulated membrane protein
MKPGFRQTMAWLHTWGGLIFTWLLFAIFFAGTLSFFRDEISLWMQPELHRVQPGGADGIDHALAALQRRAPDAKTWSITLPGPRDPVVDARWSYGKFDRAAVITLDPHSGAVLQPRDSFGGSFFRSFHFSLMARTAGEWIVFFATMMMLIALLSGIVIHKKIFKDFFTFRPGKAKPRAWLDAHNVSGVLALPFHLMITYTGLVTLMYIFMPAGIVVSDGGDKSFFASLNLRAEAPPRSTQPAALAPLAPMLDAARAHWHGAAPGGVLISHPGNAAAVVDIQQRRGAGIAARLEPVLRFDGRSGRLLTEYDADLPARNTYGVLYGLHVAWFATPLLRGLLFGMGAMGCLMIASGALIWTAKRREQHPHPEERLGFRIVEALNIAGIAGLVFASASYFWANRLLPVDLPDRASAEMQCLFAAWLLTLTYALLRGDFAHAWRDVLWAAAALLALLPLLNAVSGGLSLPQAIAQGRWALAGFDLLAFAFACALLALGRRIVRPRTRRVPRRRGAAGTAGIAS